jgi:uncharacterized protein (DUF1501 family)
MKPQTQSCGIRDSRRDFLRLGAGLPLFLQQTNLALAADAAAGRKEKYPNRILVVVEMAGGNDGLNTVVPYRNDEYYRVRPTLGQKPDTVRKLNDEFGFHNGLLGFERLFKDGEMAVIHGCGYPNPNRSHFVSMGYWHTAVPNGADTRGWLGRFADAYSPTPKDRFMVQVGTEQSLALRSKVHSPVVFSEPATFIRETSPEQKELLAKLERDQEPSANETLKFVRGISSDADKSSDFVRGACAEFRSKADYGYGTIAPDLQHVISLLQAGSPTRIYYVGMSGFDTHVNQAGPHGRLFNYLGDALQAFQHELKRIGRADDTAIMSFTEFGRRVKENASGGTDHGVASPMFVISKKAKGGFYSKFPSLTDLDEGDLKMTTDFRSVYATMLREWMGFDDTKSVLYTEFPTLGIFA